MADRSRKITELAVATSVAANNLLVVVDRHSANTPVTKSANVSVFFGNVAANVVLSNSAVLSAQTVILRNNTTPANSGVTVAAGTIWADANFIYVAVANNTVKRVALSSF